jgi:hypothetical protein
MREQHLDLLALAPRGEAFLAASNGASHVACTLVDGLGHLAGGHVRAAAGLQRAGIAIVFARPVEQRGAVVDERARAGEPLAARADVDVAFAIVGARAREGAVLPTPT